MLQTAAAAGGDDGDVYRVGDGFGHFEVKALLGAVGVHAGQQNLACAQGFALLGPLHGVLPGGDAASGHDYFIATLGPVPGVDGQHHALAAEPLRGARDEGGVLDGGGVDADFVRSRTEQFLKVLHGADAAPYRHGDVDTLHRPAHHVRHRFAGLVGGGDVQKDDLIGSLLGVVGRQLHRVACVPDVDEVDPLDHPAVPHVQTGNDSLC